MATACMRLITMVILLSVPCSSCPTSCDCSWSNTVKCQNLQVPNLESISPSLPSDTSRLEITGATFTSLGERDFAGLVATRITKITITRGQLREISDNAFTVFDYLNILELNNNQIYSISRNAFTGLNSLQALDLSRNKLTSVSSPDVFKPLLSLSTLDLSYNSMNGLKDGLLSSQSNLQKIILTGNNIGNIRGAAFKGAKRISQLIASNCNIRTIENDLFNEINMVNTLDLSYNQINSLPPNGNLNILRNLRNLTLEGNRLTALNDGQFQGLNLDSLDISKNEIRTVSLNAFTFLGSVRYLDMSHNQLKSLPEYIFQPVAAQMFSLKLNNNQGLSSLPINLFAGMQTLQDLNLSSCSLASLREEHFQYTFSLRQIDISHNLLKSLPWSFMQSGGLSHVKLDNNRWHCDCNIKPLRDWLRYPRTSNIIYCIDGTHGFNTKCAKPMCSTPTNLINRDIAMLNDDRIASCENIGASSAPPVSIIVGVVVGVVVIAVIVIVFICCVYRRHKRGEPLLCGEKNTDKRSSKPKEKNERNYYQEKKEKRRIDPDNSSLNESDKSFVVRNYFHSMVPDPDAVSQQTTSMTRKSSAESLSQSGYGYGSRHGSRHSSQYSLNAGYKIESAV